MRRLSLRRKLLLGFLVVCSLVALSAWAVLAATICSNPRVPVPETQQVIPHNCHGMTVFISNVQDSLLHWLFPAFVLLSLITVAMALSAVLKVRVDIQVKIKDTARRSPESDREIEP